MRNILSIPSQSTFQLTPVAGGDICDSFTLTVDGGDTYFVKTQNASLIDMFHAEQKGLEALRQCDTMRVPQPLGVAQEDGIALLVMSYLNLHQKTEAGQQKLGRALAGMPSEPRVRRVVIRKDCTFGHRPVCAVRFYAKD